jgi:hypothetical protein
METFKQFTEKATSKSQQRLMGMALAYKRGEMPDAPEAIKKIADGMSLKDLEDFAKTKHKGLPDKKDEDCWPGYKQVGMKKKGKKMVPNCVPEGFGLYEGTAVPLEQPLLEAEPELNKPSRNSGDGKKYVVYVKNPKTGNVKRIEFGDEKGGLTSKINDKGAAASFAARHSCDTKTDKLSPGYWACRLPKYAKDLGLKGGGDYWW